MLVAFLNTLVFETQQGEYKYNLTKYEAIKELW